MMSLLRAKDLPFSVWQLFGPGGVGKTTLLIELVRLCQEVQTPSLYLDARYLDSSCESFLNALRLAMGLSETDSPLERLAAQSERSVLFIDTYERLAGLDGWLRTAFLPQLSAQTLIVLAGRYPPSAAWRTDPGWQVLLRPLSLRNFAPSESRSYLGQRGIPPQQHQSILDFTHGHPLALSLTADVFSQGQEMEFPLEAQPNVVKILLEKFLEEVPTSAHRMALESSAIVRLTTESLLSVMLDRSDVHELFDWLRGLSCVEAGLYGIFPHDLAREVLLADLRWRNRDWYAELHHRARNYYMNRLGQTQGQEQHRVLFDYIFLHRDNPSVKPRFTWQEQSSIVTDSLGEGDRPALLAMVRKHEGEASARWAEFWLERQPQGAIIFRHRDGQLAGFVFMVALHQATEEEREGDPATRAAWYYLQTHAPLRAGEGATIFRFWMAEDTYQAVSSLQSLIFITLVQYYRSTPGLAFTFLPCTEPEFWADMFAYADLARIPAADFVIGQHCYGVYGHDWRILSPVAWQELLAQREIDASAQASPTLSRSEPLIVLSQPEFIGAVQEALRHFGRPDALRNNPLLQSRLVGERVTTQGSRSERIAALRGLVQETVESLQSWPKDAKFYRVLYRTYLQPAPSQEQAAEMLDLPFGTFRRHLKSGCARVAELLWQREIGQ
jgi:hypothetical protein